MKKLGARGDALKRSCAVSYLLSLKREIRDEYDVYAGRVSGRGSRQHGGGCHIAHSLRTQHILKCINPL